MARLGAGTDPGAGGRIALLTEGTYPYSDGGVSSWCDKLVCNLAERTFDVYAVTARPPQAAHFQPPANVASVTKVPLWEVEHPAEWRGYDGLRRIAAGRHRTSEAAVEQGFAPALGAFLGGFDRGAGLDAPGRGLVAMARFLDDHDYEVTLKSRAVWREVLRALGGDWVHRALRGAPWTVDDAQVCARWLYAFLMPLVAPPPRATLVHATAAAPCALIGLVAKIERGVPLIVTEHGVYLRERHIAAAAAEMPQLQKAFLVRFSELVARLCYAHADRLVAVCWFNQRWEIPQGARRRSLRVVHNGVDVDTFVPVAKPPERRRPTVVVVARVVPLKDIATMVRAAAVARRQLPDVHFIVYGSLTTDVAYANRIRALIAELGLEGTVELAGVHPRPTEIYAQGDIAAISSISEAFPFTLLEAMACGRPVVATDVGGVSEIVGTTGRLVPPRDPEALGSTCVELLRDEPLRLTLGRQARGRVLARFRDTAMYDEYRCIYDELASGHEGGWERDEQLFAAAA